VSENDFRIIWDNLAGGDRTTRDRLVPYCMFTDSPLARWRQEGHPPRRGYNLSEWLCTTATSEAKSPKQRAGRLSHGCCHAYDAWAGDVRGRRGKWLWFAVS
jgi:hypothetical protein